MGRTPILYEGLTPDRSSDTGQPYYSTREIERLELRRLFGAATHIVWAWPLAIALFLVGQEGWSPVAVFFFWLAWRERAWLRRLEDGDDDW